MIIQFIKIIKIKKNKTKYTKKLLTKRLLTDKMPHAKTVSVNARKVFILYHDKVASQSSSVPLIYL